MTNHNSPGQPPLSKHMEIYINDELANSKDNMAKYQMMRSYLDTATESAAEDNEQIASGNSKLVMVRNQFIPSLRRQDLPSDDNRPSTEETNTPAHSAKDPRLVEFPANKESILVVK